MQMGSKRRWKTPGPGSYNSDNRPVTPCPPSFSMGARWGDFTQGLDWEPGPGTYAASAHRMSRCRDGPAYTIAARTASSSSPSAAPAGPGGHTLKTSDAPGPGSYNISERACALTRHHDPAYTIASRVSSILSLYPRDISPGPGAYCVPAADRGPAFSMSAHGRKLLVGADSRHTAQTPGPGSYSAVEVLQRPRTPSITISASRDPRRNSSAVATTTTTTTTSPGPGSYNPLQSPRGPAFTISCRRKQQRLLEESPGPGHYYTESADVQTHPRDPMVSISGKSKAGVGSAGADSGSTPGPGAYDPRKATATAAAITISGRPVTRRRPLNPADMTPGPGAYFLTTPPTSNYPSPAIKIAGRNTRPPGWAAPGPGAYSPRLEREGPAITITAKKQVSSVHHHLPHQEGPGPAAYFPDNRYYSNLRSPAVSMGIRFSKRSVEASPGPGAYTLPEPHLGPAFSMHSASERYTFA